MGFEVVRLEGKLDLYSLGKELILFEFEWAFQVDKVLRKGTRRLGNTNRGVPKMKPISWLHRAKSEGIQSIG